MPSIGSLFRFIRIIVRNIIYMPKPNRTHITTFNQENINDPCSTIRTGVRAAAAIYSRNIHF
jgi:hypothetical protein